MLCNKYMGDNDATSPTLTCIREKGHPGLCDNVSDEPDNEIDTMRQRKNDARMASAIDNVLVVLLSTFASRVDAATDDETRKKALAEYEELAAKVADVTTGT